VTSGAIVAMSSVSLLRKLLRCNAVNIFALISERLLVRLRILGIVGKYSEFGELFRFLL